VWNSHVVRTTGHSPDQLLFLHSLDSKSLNPLTMQQNEGDSHIIDDNDTTYKRVNTNPINCLPTPVQLSYFKDNVEKLSLAHIDENIMWEYLEKAIITYNYCVNNL